MSRSFARIGWHQITREANDVVCLRCAGSGIEPVVDPDEAAADEFYEMLRNMARRHWTVIAEFEVAGARDILDADIVDELDTWPPAGS